MRSLTVTDIFLYFIMAKVIREDIVIFTRLFKDVQNECVPLCVSGGLDFIQMRRCTVLFQLFAFSWVQYIYWFVTSTSDSLSHWKASAANPLYFCWIVKSWTCRLQTPVFPNITCWLTDLTVLIDLVNYCRINVFLETGL